MICSRATDGAPRSSSCSLRRVKMADLAAANRLLHSVFGFADFRAGQAEIIETIVAGRDVLAVMPTGSGKSLCYQLPALMRDGLTVVVSPLIALMRNQVAQLRSYGIAAASLNSSNDFDQNRQIEQDIARGELRLVYIAPGAACEGGHDSTPAQRQGRHDSGRRGSLHIAMGP